MKTSTENEMCRHYRLFNNAPIFETGVLSDGNQMILGPTMSNIIAILFTPEGDYVKTLEILVEPPLNTYESFEETAEENKDAFRKEYCFTSSPVLLKKFFIPDYPIGIEDIPEHYLDETFPCDEIDRWKSNGNFVFYWVEDYYIDGKTGEIESS